MSKIADQNICVEADHCEANRHIANYRERDAPFAMAAFISAIDTGFRSLR